MYVGISNTRCGTVMYMIMSCSLSDTHLGHNSDIVCLMQVYICCINTSRTVCEWASNVFFLRRWLWFIEKTVYSHSLVNARHPFAILVGYVYRIPVCLLHKCCSAYMAVPFITMVTPNPPMSGASIYLAAFQWDLDGFFFKNSSSGSSANGIFRAPTTSKVQGRFSCHSWWGRCT